MSRSALRQFLFILFSCSLFGICPAFAGSSHARVVRLSLVQGDVRFVRQAHGDPLSDNKATWEAAALNLPIRQGYVVATDNGRAEVEFENGALAFLSDNTVLEFYDLSLEDGVKTTRLVLRQGSASFYVNSATGDYFSVTGGDFTVEAADRASFHVDNFDDGSTVKVTKGHISVLHKDQTTALANGQSFSMKAGDEKSAAIGGAPQSDEFDRWVSNRTETVVAATNAATQYTNASYVAPGFADLYTYGSWFSCGGAGYGWRPFGVGAAWSPFSSGQWISDPGLGWTFVSYQPWGWAPYHYGGWLFDSSCGGWFYSPPILFVQNPRKRFPPVVHPPHPVYRATTAVFLRQKGNFAVVPMHPLDKEGKTPLNFQHGVFSVSPTGSVSPNAVTAETGEKWQTLKSAPREALSGSLPPTTPPTRVYRTEAATTGTHAGLDHGSSTAYDAHEHRFIDTNTAASGANLNGRSPTQAISSQTSAIGSQRDKVNTRQHPAEPTRAYAATPPRPARTMTPPPAPRSSTFGGGSSRSSAASGGPSWHSPAPAAPSHPPSAPAGRPH